MIVGWLMEGNRVQRNRSASRSGRGQAAPQNETVSMQTRLLITQRRIGGSRSQRRPGQPPGS